jgi:hypothetical protein
MSLMRLGQAAMGVDADIVASNFTTSQTINMGANIVGY